MKMEEIAPGAQLYGVMKTGFVNRDRRLLRLGAAAGFAILLVLVPWSAAHLVIWSQTPRMLILPSSIPDKASIPATAEKPSSVPAQAADRDSAVSRLD
ncbi:MAG: hypothetical protein ABSH22_00405 [Tepidisphaeraceae bacterium]|jgi:hypothetical protein